MMTSALLRIGAPDQVRVKPLLGGLDTLPEVWLLLAEKATLNQCLALGELDCALLPVLDVAGHPRMRVIPGICLCAQPGTPEHCAIPPDTPGLEATLPYVEFVWGARFGAPLPALRRILTLALQTGLEANPNVAVNAYRLASAEMDGIRACLRDAAQQGHCPSGMELTFC